MFDGSEYDQEQFIEDCQRIANTLGLKINNPPSMLHVYWGRNFKITSSYTHGQVSISFNGNIYYPASVVGNTAFSHIPVEVKSLILHTVVELE